jgi:hypothetical protein
METLYITFLIIILSKSISSQWFWQNPKPQINDIINSHTIDEVNGWSISAYVPCTKTTDGGNIRNNLKS